MFLDVELLNAIANGSPHVIKFLTVMTLCNTVIPIKRLDLSPVSYTPHPALILFHHLFLPFFPVVAVLADQFRIKLSPKTRMPLSMWLQICIWFSSVKMETLQAGFMTPNLRFSFCMVMLTK
jgi:hypothetical protein